MKISDYIEQSFSNLFKKKLRTFLTTFGVVIGIGALVSMFSFGEGMQKNITDSFKELGLFNYITIYPSSDRDRDEHYNTDFDEQYDQIQDEEAVDSPNSTTLDDDFLKEIREIQDRSRR